MTIITLTTDLGLKDFFVGALKGAIYSQLDDARIVDISHQIEPFNLIQASFVLRNAYQNFPKGTIHIVGINSNNEKNVKNLSLYVDGHYFIGFDNGIFSLTFNKHPDKIVELNIPQDTDLLIFPAKDIFVKAACHIARGGTLEVIGKEISHIKELSLLQPIVQNNIIKGTVIYIDVYGNVITNISKSVIKQEANIKKCVINFSRNEFINGINETYDSVEPGERLCLFGSSGNLEIAINQGNASGLLGLSFGDTIRVELNGNKNS